MSAFNQHRSYALGIVGACARYAVLLAHAPAAVEPWTAAGASTPACWPVTLPIACLILRSDREPARPAASEAATP